MKIKVTNPVTTGPKDTFVISLACYAGDADYRDSDTLVVPKEKIAQRIAEVVLMKNQFTHGRGGCRRMFDQVNYFCLPYDDYEEGVSDDHWDWLDPELGDYPRDYEGGEQNYTLESWTVDWYDASGTRYAVELTDLEPFIAKIAAFNKANHIGDYRSWEDNSQGLDEKFAAYRLDAIAMVKEFVATVVIEMP